MWGCFILLSCLSAGPVCSAQANVEITDVLVGLEGGYRVGHWTTVRLDVQSATAAENVRVELTLPDGDGVTSTLVSEATLTAGNNQLEAIAKFGRTRGNLHVAVRSSDGTLLAEKSISEEALPDAVLGSQNLIVALGGESGVREAIAMRREKDDQQSILTTLSDASQAPREWFGYAGASLVVLPGDGGIASELTQEQAAALELWVRLGGRLIFCAGPSATDLLGDDSPLASLLPGEFERVQMQRQTTGLENYAGKTLQALTSFVAEGDLVFRLPMAVIRKPRGTVEVFEGIGGERTPLVIRASHGFGQIIYVALDFNSAPLSQWPDGRKRVFSNLLDLALGAVKRNEATSDFVPLAQIGFEDMTGQLRGSLDQFESVRMVPFSWIGFLVGLYILLIGPVDYFLLRSMNKRFGLTWLTFPLIVLAGCVLAYLLTQHWKGQTLRANHVDIVDIDTRTGFLRGQSWGHLFSPSSRSYDLALDTTTLGLELTGNSGKFVSWQGLPGRSFGGMNTTRLSQSPGYEMVGKLGAGADELTIRGLPIDTYASRSLNGLVWGEVQLDDDLASLESDLDKQLTGSVRNPLPVPLRDCLLCYGRWVYPLPSLAPGGQESVDRLSRIKTIDGMLTRTQVDKDFKDRSQPWDRRSLDRKRILQMMMFYKAGGGEEYTSLLNRFQQDVDFSDHLTQGTAILIGTSDTPATKLLAEDVASDSTTYYRILIPVKQPQR